MDGTKSNFRRSRGSDGGVDTGPVFFKTLDFEQSKFNDFDHAGFKEMRMEKSTSHHIILPISTLKRLREQLLQGETKTTYLSCSSDGDRCGTGESRNASVSSEFEVASNREFSKSSHVSTPESYDTDSSGKESGYLTLEDLEEQFRVKLPWHATNQNLKNCEKQTQVSFEDIIESQRSADFSSRSNQDFNNNKFSEDDFDDDDETSDGDDDVFLANTDDNANIQLQAISLENVDKSDVCQVERRGKVEGEVYWNSTGESPLKKSASYAIMIKPDQLKAFDANRLSKLDNCESSSILKTSKQSELNGNSSEKLLSNTNLAEDQIYMSWEEVMMEAQHLGIKLSIPRAKKKERVWFAITDNCAKNQCYCKSDVPDATLMSSSNKQMSESVDVIFGLKKFFGISKLKRSSKGEFSLMGRSLSTMKKHKCCCECYHVNTRCSICRAKPCHLKPHILSSNSRVCQLHSINHRCLTSKTSSSSASMNYPKTIKTFYDKFDSPKYDFMTCLKLLQHKDWYWGSCSVEKIEEHLRGKDDGSFILRDSSDDRYVLTLSYSTCGRIRHARIEHHKDKFRVKDSYESRLISVPEFIPQIDEIFGTSSKSLRRVCYFVKFEKQTLNYFETAITPANHQIHLLKPVSKTRCLLALKSFCKLSILKHVKVVDIQQLPVCSEICDFLKERSLL